MTTMSSAADARYIEVRNPADASVVGQVPLDGRDVVATKVAALRRAQPDWEDLGPNGRAVWLRRLQEWLLDNAAHLADVLQSETSKPRTDAAFEVPMIADLINYYVKNAASFLSDQHPRPHSPIGRTKRLLKIYRPYPVVGVISPWNFPLAMPGLDVIPALTAGAAVILKPSEVTPLSGEELVRGWREIGAPPVFDAAHGAGATGAAVVDHVDYVQFTGSTRTGRVIAQSCATRLIPYSLELGGKDPAIVLSDADLDRAAHGIAFGGLINSGQLCVSVERIYVEAAVHRQFVDKLTQHVAQLRQGRDDAGYRYDLGGLANAQQRDLVQRHVDQAVEAGARVTTGGKPTGVGTFFEPTVLVDVDHSMSCIQEETFGPTLPVMRVADEAEAIRLANDSNYGLSASVWTRDRRRGLAVARQLEVGAVNINDVAANLFSFALPMGGWKESGVGARWGAADGLRKYCRQQAVTIPRTPVPKKELFWFPYSPMKVKLTHFVMRMSSARGWRRLGILGRGSR
jgi:acyl-CoA reductase-like NAD-dependent aldehyde dehydrogenase